MKLIVGNLKMNLLSSKDREKYIAEFKKETKDLKLSENRIILCVPAIHLEGFTKKLHIRDIAIGGQNIFWEDEGSYTGEISAKMLKGMEAEYAIIGHSERRKYFGETSGDANLKIKAAFRNKLTPIYCVGETLEEKNGGNAEEAVIRQVSEAFIGLSESQARAVIVAYEPIWSVGSDKIPTSDEILQMKILIKKTFAKLYNADIAEKISLLYGGSVKAEFVQQVCLKPGLDGVLVGRESLVPKDFVKIVKAIQN